MTHLAVAEDTYLDIKETVVLNVGGSIFETTYETLRSQPDTILGSLDHNSIEYNNVKGHFFFDRNSDVFSCILDFYRTGNLHLPMNICGATIRCELEFWQIPPVKIADCCLQTYFKYDMDREVIDTLKNAFDAKFLDYNLKEDEQRTWVKIKRNVWLFLDQPGSSRSARNFSYFYLGFVILSAILFCCEFHKDFREGRIVQDNTTDYGFYNPNNPKEVMIFSTKPIFTLVVGGWIVLLFFSIEFVTHFSFCPQKLKFFKSGLNCLDCILFISMWMVYAFETHDDILFKNQKLNWFYMVLKSLMILRLFRLLRLVKQYSALRILTVSLLSSLKELGLLLITFLMASVFYASFIYFAELSEPTTFPDIFIGIWWSVVTMTTVGYGDIYPKSTLGYVVGSACAICGVLILSMPIAIVATKFSNFNDRNNERERSKALEKRELPLEPRPSSSKSRFLMKVASSSSVKPMKTDTSRTCLNKPSRFNKRYMATFDGSLSANEQSTGEGRVSPVGRSVSSDGKHSPNIAPHEEGKRFETDI